jgi:hypothetical protein
MFSVRGLLLYMGLELVCLFIDEFSAKSVFGGHGDIFLAGNFFCREFWGDYAKLYYSA